MSYTPGPWQYCEEAGRHNVFAFVPNGEAQRMIYVCEDIALDANARLIAAAPDLLAACEAMLEYMSPNDHRRKQARCRMIAAVQKARGEA